MKRVAAFAGLTLLLSWPLWFAVMAGKATLTPVGAFAPGAAALITAAIGEGRSGVREIARRLTRWRFSGRWTAVAALFAPAIVAAALAIARPGPADWSKLPLFPLVFAEVLLFTSLGEETGWRGYLLPALLERFGPLRASAVVGLFWALWHLPLFSIPGTAQSSIPFGYFAANLVAFSVIYTWLFRCTEGSLLPALLLHTMTDTSLAMAAIVFPAAGESEPFWVAYFWLVIGAAVAVALVSLRRSSAAG